MNIFILDKVPELAATYHCDKHVPKMIVETAQILSTAHHALDEQQAREGIYKIAHLNHPCSIWARESYENYRWLHRLGEGLIDEYKARYGHHKVHKTEPIMDLLRDPPRQSQHLGLTPFAQAMPDEYKHEDAVTAYRTYYMSDKAPICDWRLNTPNWWKETKYESKKVYAAGA